MSKPLFLIINVGSMSVKTHLFAIDLQITALLNADFGSSEDMIIEGSNMKGERIYQHKPSLHNAEAALSVMLTMWREIIAAEGGALSAIGHRIVHGGGAFEAITPITPAILHQIAQLDDYAPLHNPLNRLGVAMAGNIFPEIAQFAVFDTAFHRRIPACAGRYAIPPRLSSKVDFYRYGFHGISCQHSLSAAAALLGRDQASLNLIVLHLGGGASITALRAGISVDTSMGFSPLEGLMMSERCGDLDPMIVITLQREGRSADEIDQLLNHQSGLRAVCGIADMRGVLEKAEQGDESALLAIDMYCYRIKKYIGAYCAVLGDVSALIFTGGIGEHASVIRHQIVQGLDALGFALDMQANQQQSDQNRVISGDNSRFPVLVIHAEEEREIARQILIFQGNPDHS